MNFELSDLTIVVTGSWNVGIFDAPWVSTNVFQGQNINMEMALGAAAPVLRYHCGRTTLIVQPDKLIGGYRDTSSEATHDVAAMVRTILQQLVHTPVNAVGINFGFREAEPSAELLDNFAVADNQKINQLGAEIRQTAIIREVVFDGGLLRLQETLEDSGAAHFHLNFHYDVQNAGAAADILAAAPAEKRARALQLMQRVYNLQPEENNVQ